MSSILYRSGVTKIISGFILFTFLLQPFSVFASISYSDGTNLVVKPTSFKPQNLGYTESPTGAFIYPVKFQVPEGRGGITPDITLTYNSQDKNDHNWFGYGWSMEVPYIETQNLTGVQTMYDKKYFLSSVSGDLKYSSTASTTEIYYPRISEGELLTYKRTSGTWTAEDHNGNLSAKDTGSDTYTYLYDWNNRLSGVEENSTSIATYGYTDTRDRLWKDTSTSTSTTYFISDQVEYAGSNYTNYFFAGNQRILTDDGTLHYNHQDHLQSSTLTTDTLGTMEESVLYTPYGNEQERLGSHQSDYTYTDQYQDTETGLLYYDARYYDPELARFTSIDPASVRLATNESTYKQLIPDPQQQNTYSYARNNPLKYNDPTGEIVPVVAAVAIAIDIGFTAYDGYRFGETLTDPNATLGDKAVAGGQVAFDIAGGGLIKMVSESVNILGKVFKVSAYSSDVKNAWVGTNMSVEQSLSHHYKKHVTDLGGTITIEQYTSYAKKFYSTAMKNQSAYKIKSVTLKDGSTGIKIRDRKTGEMGIYNKKGKIVTYDRGSKLK